MRSHNIPIDRSFGMLGQTFMDEEPKGALLNNFTTENKQVSFWTIKYCSFKCCCFCCIFERYPHMESKIFVWRRKSEKSVQENAGTGGDSITSTLVDYPINLSYLSSRMS